MPGRHCCLSAPTAGALLLRTARHSGHGARKVCRSLSSPASALPRPHQQVGRIRNVIFSDIQAVAENGLFLAGGPMPPLLSNGDKIGGSSRADDASGGGSGGGSGSGRGGMAGSSGAGSRLGGGRRHSISGVVVKRLHLRLQRRTHWPGGCQDYRPSRNISSDGGSSSRDGWGGAAGKEIMAGIGGGSVASEGWWPAGLDCGSGSTAAVWVAGADSVHLSDVRVSGATLGGAAALASALVGEA